MDSKKIFSNSIFLFSRLLITTVVVFFSTRIILDNLGIEDYGIYNVVAGAVVLFTFVNNAMTSSTQRNLTFESVRGNLNDRMQVFNAAFRIHFIFAIISVILLETAGQYFFYKILNIPNSRLFAAQIVFQSVIFMFFVNIASVPFQAAINAYEDMDILAKIGVLDSVLKLGIAFLIGTFSSHRLEIYSILLFFSTLLVGVFYWLYCKKKYEDCLICNINVNKEVYIRLTGFASWTIFGSLASLVRKQGSVIILNIFFGPTINASYGIANQISNQMLVFSETLLKAIGPSIVKSYSSDRMDNVTVLLFTTSRYAFFLFSILAVPLYLEMGFVLKLWLKNVPDHTLIFSQLILFNVLIDVIIGPMISAIQATGKIKSYQIFSGITYLLNIPVAYGLLKFGFSSQYVIVSNIIFTLIMGGIRLYFLKVLVGLSIWSYVTDVLLKVIQFSLLFIPIVYVSHMFFFNGFAQLVLTFFSSIFIGLLLVYLAGSNALEREVIKNFIKKRRF